MKIYQTMFKSMTSEKEISKDILEKHIKEKRKAYLVRKLIQIIIQNRNREAY